MKSIISFFRKIQWKLTISYALVTAGTVMVLAAVMVGIALFVESRVTSRTFDSFYWSKTGFQDNIPYLLDDQDALQSWLDRVQAHGFLTKDFTSTTLRETLDYANTLIIKTSPIFVLDTDLNLIAASPNQEDSTIEDAFDVNSKAMQEILGQALEGHKIYDWQSIPKADGSFVAAFPLRKSDEEPIDAIVVYMIKPMAFATPTNLTLYTTFFGLTSMIMLIISFPVGALFGWLVSRGFSKRLTSLSFVTEEWRKGDFSKKVNDRSGDEIGELTRSLNNMAEQLQTYIQTKDELTRIEERNYLARELHDTVKQQTYAARMQLSAAKNLVTTNPDAAQEHIEAALQLNRETQQELKQIIEQLRPAALEGAGLVQAVITYLERWQEHTGIHADFRFSGEREIPLDVEQGLYRVIQEGLSNIARHAESDTVELSIRFEPQLITLTIEDHGRGFDPEEIPSGSMGLAGMRQRLQEINGRLMIESIPAVGTKLTVVVNLAQNDSRRLNDQKMERLA